MLSIEKMRNDCYFWKIYLPKNTSLIEEGKICSISHFIEEGCARLYTHDTQLK